MPSRSISASARRVSMAVHGVDVSRWQGDIDWPKLRSQGANFAYIKATDGGDHLDPMFKTNWRKADGSRAEARRLSLLLLVPHRRRAGRLVHPQRAREVEGALPPVIDVEWNGESELQAAHFRASGCWRRCRSSWTSSSAITASARSSTPPPTSTATTCRANSSTIRSGCARWPQHPSKVYPGRKWVFWQYSGSGLSHGVERPDRPQRVPRQRKPVARLGVRPQDRCRSELEQGGVSRLFLNAAQRKNPAVFTGGVLFCRFSVEIEAGVGGFPPAT